jgi:phosphohistidine phosphatase SixA
VRRAALALLLALAGCGGAGSTESASLDPVQLVEALQEGGLVVYLRHAATDMSQVERNVSELERCEGQRNLTARGREQARRIGAAFRALSIPVGDVLASEYCRTRQTAELAFGKFELEPRLTGFPNSGSPGYEARLNQTKELLASVPAARENTILVAHVKNIEAAAQLTIEEGELAVFEPLGTTSFRALGRIPDEAWPQLVSELGR